MESQLRLGRVFGIEIGLHYSWFLIALLIVLSLVGQFRATQPQWGGPTIWISAVVTGLLFFSALILHELSHALTARARGLPVGANPVRPGRCVADRAGAGAAGHG